MYRSLFVAACAAFLSSSASAQVFSDWEDTGIVSLELYVGPTGQAGNTGLANSPTTPLRTITQALADAAAQGQLGVAPVTINVQSGAGTSNVYDAAAGEAFPIALPAHGVAIEAYSLNPLRPVVRSQNVPHTFLFNTVGNPALPESVLQGLSIANDFQIQDSADVRINVPSATAGLDRVAPEIRDCHITGEPFIGIDVVGNAGTYCEPIIERNRIAGIDPLFGDFGVRTAGSASPMSEVIRSNEIHRWKVNLSMSGGYLAHQPRVFSNYIQVAETNVTFTQCAPWIVNNTIAFAFSTTAPTVFGITWSNVPAVRLSNNLIWNPDQGGVTAIDVVNGGGFSQPQRAAMFNFDEDGTLAANTLIGFNWSPSNPPVATWPAGFGQPITPGFSSDPLGAGSGTSLTNLDLLPNSSMRETGLIQEIAGFGLTTAALVSALPGGPAPINIRIDCGFDIDSEGRVTGNAVDIGADESTLLLGAAAASATRAATLAPTVGSTLGNDVDSIGNMVPFFGAWITQFDVVGQPGDIVALMGGFAFNQTIPNPTGPGVVENGPLFEHLMLAPALIPGFNGFSSLTTPLAPLSIQINTSTVVIPASGRATINLVLGAANPAFAEAELELQAYVLSIGSASIQATNRLTLDINM